jgi:glycosyltransferase involved in cell wall biosynthesis
LKQQEFNYIPLAEPVPITEQEWPEGTLPIVHTRTMTYNHVNYISDCIESILRQKTTFPVAVLIHDDASTDGTAEIVSAYQQRYPNLIKAYLQQSNSFGKDKRHLRAEFLSWCTGKYIAVCEGDDYWSDPFKLQIQVDHMESDPETCVCVHASTVEKSSTGKMVRRIRPSTSSRYFTTEEVIAGGGGLFATNSMLYKRPSNSQRPPYFKNSKVGDYPLMIYLSTLGKVYYVDRILSVYRTGIHGSWTSTTHSGNIQTMVNQKNNSIQLLSEVDVFYENKFATVIQKKIREIEFERLLLEGELDTMQNTEYVEFYKKLHLSKKIGLRVFGKFYPTIYSILKRASLLSNRLIERTFNLIKFRKNFITL